MGGQNEAGLGQKSQLYPPGGHGAVRAPSVPVHRERRKPLCT